jgi:magnesium-transporting ATPase (P-type)
VGDIIELDYKEKIPASGILITSHEVVVGEEKYGRKNQRKMTI